MKTYMKNTFLIPDILAFNNLKELEKNVKRRGYTCEKDGVTYEPFEKVPVPGCEHECYCPEFGGSIRCKALRCPVPLCIDPEETPGSCCPSCVNGIINFILSANCLNFLHRELLLEKKNFPEGENVGKVTWGSMVNHGLVKTN